MEARMKLTKELDVAIKAAELAAAKIMEIYSKDFTVCYKNDQSPVTEADILANQVILETLSAAFPEDGFLSEEDSDDYSRKKKKRFWVIDPLDGTKEFIKKNGEFSVNIGLVENGKTILGVIYLPVRARTYYAVHTQGAYRKEKDGQPIQVHVSDRIKPYGLLISRSHPTKKTLTLMQTQAHDILHMAELGSSIKGCLIAEGLYDVYYNFGHSMKWDTCAMECIVTEAGGIMRRLDDRPIDYLEDDTKNYGFYIINHIKNRIEINDF